MHVAHKVFTERNEEEDANDATQERCQEDFEEADADLGIGELRVKDVEGREGEDGTSHNHARAGTDGLDDDIFAKRILALGGRSKTDGDDGDGDSCLKDLSDLEAEIGGGCTEDDCHEQAPDE